MILIYRRKQLHAKAIGILELIERVEKRIKQSEKRLIEYDKAGFFDTIQLFNTREGIELEISSNKAILQRLIHYYINTYNKLNV
jgi:hypothetical protein